MSVISWSHKNPRRLLTPALLDALSSWSTGVPFSGLRFYVNVFHACRATLNRLANWKSGCAVHTRHVAKSTRAGFCPPKRHHDHGMFVDRLVIFSPFSRQENVTQMQGMLCSVTLRTKRTSVSHGTWSMIAAWIVTTLREISVENTRVATYVMCTPPQVGRMPCKPKEDF